jgi:membrane protein DedA with SNARE-associated domain
LCLLGYQFGHALRWLVAHLRVLEQGLMAALLLAAVTWALWRRLRHG